MDPPEPIHACMETIFEGGKFSIILKGNFQRLPGQFIEIFLKPPLKAFYVYCLPTPGDNYISWRIFSNWYGSPRQLKFYIQFFVKLGL